MSGYEDITGTDSHSCVCPEGLSIFASTEL